jgi:hypothetical protein
MARPNHNQPDPQITAFFAQMAAAKSQQPPPDPNLSRTFYRG